LPIALLKNGKAENLSATSIIVLTLDDNITCHYRVRSRHLNDENDALQWTEFPFGIASYLGYVAVNIAACMEA